MAFVLDGSVTMAWCFADETSPVAEALFDSMVHSEAVVPAIWPLEVANVLLIAERRGRLTEAQATRFVEVLHGLNISVDAGALDSALGMIRALAREHRLSSYDAAYLELAARADLPLATLDAHLRTAAVRMGVSTVE